MKELFNADEDDGSCADYPDNGDYSLILKPASNINHW